MRLDWNRVDSGVALCVTGKQWGLGFLSLEARTVSRQVASVLLTMSSSLFLRNSTRVLMTAIKISKAK